MGLSCEIRFPYNWAEEFYYGERLHLSVSLRCHKKLTVKGVALSVSCGSERETQSNDYSRYIDDQEEECSSQNNCLEKTSRKHCSEIDLFGEGELPISLIPGTYMFDVECFLPEITIEEHQAENNEISFKFSVIARRIPKTDTAQKSPISALQLILLEPTKRVTFVWPGYFNHISSFSVASASIGFNYVKNLEWDNNRQNYSEESSSDDSLETWLDCVLEKPEAVEDNSGEEEETGFPEDDDASSKGGHDEEKG